MPVAGANLELVEAAGLFVLGTGVREVTKDLSAPLWDDVAHRIGYLCHAIELWSLRSHRCDGPNPARDRARRLDRESTFPSAACRFARTHRSECRRVGTSSRRCAAISAGLQLPFFFRS